MGLKKFLFVFTGNEGTLEYVNAKGEKSFTLDMAIMFSKSSRKGDILTDVAMFMMKVHNFCWTVPLVGLGLRNRNCS